MRQAVGLNARRTTSVTLVLRDPVPQLALVMVKREVIPQSAFGPARVGGFYDRTRKGFGHFITPEDIARIKPLRTTDLVRTIPGVSAQTVFSPGKRCDRNAMQSVDGRGASGDEDAGQHAWVHAQRRS